MIVSTISAEIGLFSHKQWRLDSAGKVGPKVWREKDKQQQQT